MALFLASLVYGFWKVFEPTFVEASLFNNDRALTCTGVWKVAILLFWILAPPLWFWMEYFGLYRYDSPDAKPDWDSFKYGQDISAKIWLAFVTALTILYFGKDIGPK